MARSGGGRPALSVFLLLLGVYLATSSFRVETIDTAVRLEVARSLARGDGGAIQPLTMRTPFGLVGSFPGRDGRHYSVYGLGQSLLMIPGTWFGPDRDAALATLINPVATALTGAILVLMGLALGYSRRAAVGTALLFGLGTLAWPHAKFTFEAPLEMLAGTAAMFALLRAGPRASLAAGALFGAALLVRPSAVVMLPALIWWQCAPGRRVARLAEFAAGGAPWVLLALAYNAYRWGSPLATGYVQTSYQYFAWQWEGWVGLLLSPGRGFFWYSPMLLLGLFFFRCLRERHVRLYRAAAIFIGSYGVFLSFVTVWSGDWTWGPRHLLPIVPVLALGLLPALERGVPRAWLGGLVAASLAVQCVGVSLNYETYYLWHNQWVRETGARERAGDYHFDAPRSQLYVQSRQAWLFFSQWRPRMNSFRPGEERSPYASVLGGSPRITKRVPDLWWFYFPLAGRGTGEFAAMSVLCGGLVAGGAWGLWRRSSG